MSILHINIVTLNNLNYLSNAIGSIKTSYDYKIRVIDQDSTDGVQEWCRNNQIDCYRFSPKRSLSEAWNFGFREAIKDEECKYIFFPNNDVIFHKSTIDNLIYGINKLGYSMVTGSNVEPEMSLSDMLAKDDFGSLEFDEREITNWREEGPDFSCPLIKRQTLEQVGYFDENYYPAYYEDNDYHLRIIKSGLHAKRLTTAPYFHFGSMTIKNNGHLGISSNSCQRLFIEKWGNTPSECMDNKGYEKPFNDNNNSLKFWKGYEKYEL